MIGDDQDSERPMHGRVKFADQNESIGSIQIDTERLEIESKAIEKAIRKAQSKAMVYAPEDANQKIKN